MAASARIPTVAAARLERRRATLVMQHNHTYGGCPIEPDDRLEMFAFSQCERPGTAVAWRVEVAAVRIADALPARQPVRAGPHPEGELAAVRKPLGHRGAAGALEANVRKGTLGGHGGADPDLGNPQL